MLLFRVGLKRILSQRPALAVVASKMADTSVMKTIKNPCTCMDWKNKYRMADFVIPRVGQEEIQNYGYVWAGGSVTSIEWPTSTPTTFEEQSVGGREAREVRRDLRHIERCMERGICGG